MELSGKRIAITGIGGFIGRRLAERALERGMAVQGLENSTAAARDAESLGVKVVVGDVRDAEAVRKALEDADVVVHTAAIVKESGSFGLFHSVNVEGTRTVAGVAREMGVRRFVQISSVMVYGFDPHEGTTEEGPYCGEDNPYCTTKLESEEAAMELHEPGNMEVIVIRPGDVYGPRSRPWVVRPVEMMKRGLFMLPDGGKGIINHVYVDNLIDGIFLALEKDATGEAFNITDDQATTFYEFFRRLALMAGKQRIPTLPRWAVRPVFAVIEGVSKALGIEPPATSAALSFVGRQGKYSIEKARRRLGYEPRVNLDEGMSRTRDWLASEGMIS